MPRQTPEVTARDRTVLREILRLTAASPAALAHLFPSRGAAYVRLGILAERGFIERTHSFGRRVYVVTFYGAEAVGLRAMPGTPGPTARIARLATIATVLAPLGYQPAPAPRSGFSKSLAWFASHHRFIAVYSTPARLTGHRVRRLLGRLQIIRHRAHAVILAGNDQTMSRSIPPSQYPSVLIVPVPLSAEARALITHIV